MAEVGVATSIGVRAPDVAWCSDTYLQAHPEEMPLSAAPELCVEIVSIHNALPKLREKAMAYVRAGAREAWLYTRIRVRSRSTASKAASPQRASPSISRRSSSRLRTLVLSAVVLPAAQKFSSASEG